MMKGTGEEEEEEEEDAHGRGSSGLRRVPVQTSIRSIDDLEDHNPNEDKKWGVSWWNERKVVLDGLLEPL